MKVFIYDCCIYCEDCAERVKIRIREDFPAEMNEEEQADYREILRDGWNTNGGGEADSPQHCDSGSECVNAIEIGGERLGAWLENPLTSDGREYVRSVIRKREGLLWRLWAEWYREGIGFKIVG